ncbi:uncharacterized protein LOC129928192 [Biomphalaria glabrata]|uniref:Uncharacterized protein LOC129928192 n=1 Tax=Biomphalaria glabrata TaxID=6526 RepID=A0A9W3BCS7_BIOGL|nr:uncharacterized protein LOC129928192 [Biomphalaria glabrata]
MASNVFNISLAQENPFSLGSQDIISESAANVIVQVLILLMETFSLFGILVNTINLIVFYKQGFKATTNIAFLALSFADLFNLVDVELGLVFYNSFIVNAFPYPIERTELSNITSTPHPAFARVRSWIFVFLTTERCLCIVFPLKIKRIITPFRTVVVLVIIYMLNIAVVVPFWFDMYVDWKYYPNVNKTMLGVKYRFDRTYVRAPVHVTLAVIMFTSFPIVVFFTCVLIWKLQKVSRWRLKSVKTDQLDSTSHRDKTIVRMVVAIACVLIVSLAPSMVYFLLTSVSLYFDASKYKQSITVFSWFAYLLDVINSCVNILFYYQMSSNYKHIFIKTFFPCGSCAIGLK